MSNQRQYELPELFPQPKQLVLTEGNSELSVDIRLVTSNVLPVQRKAIRSILTSTGVKVVANKKKYVVSATVLPQDSFDLSQVPEDARQEYYELEIRNSEVTIKAPFQEGTVWAAQTLAGIYRRLQRQGTIPNMIIRDWPLLPVRGIFVEDKWGADRMVPTDWYQTIDALASAKLNTLGVGIYGCWGECRFEGPESPTEFLMVPVLDHQELQSPHRLRWFSPEIGDFKDQTYLPQLFTFDFFADIVAYGRERGISVVPYLNSLGHNTLIPRLCPEISARLEDGTPAGTGYCLSNPKLKTFLESFYGSIIKRYYPNGISQFHIQLDEVYDDHSSPEDPTRTVSPWCQCPHCKAKSHARLLQEYILWLVQMLVSKGVDKVVLWNDTLTRHEEALTPDFIRQIRESNLQDHIVFDFWDYSNQAINPKSYPELATRNQLHAWVSPMTCYYDWSTYSYHLPNVGLMMGLCFSQNAEGAVAYSVHNPSHLDHEAALAAAAWENTGESGQEYARRWAVACFGQEAEDFLKATELITQAADLAAYRSCLYYNHVYVGKNWPNKYPQDSMDALMANPQESTDQLRKALDQATQAESLIRKLLAGETKSELQTDCLKSLRAEAVRIIFLTKAFLGLMDLKLAFAQNGGMVRKTQAAACKALEDELFDLLALAEKNFPIWLAPVALAALTPVFEFIRQLQPKLIQFNGKKKASAIDWNLPYVPPPPPAAPNADEY